MRAKMLVAGLTAALVAVGHVVAAPVALASDCWVWVTEVSVGDGSGETSVTVSEPECDQTVDYEVEYFVENDSGGYTFEYWVPAEEVETVPTGGRADLSALHDQWANVGSGQWLPLAGSTSWVLQNGPMTIYYRANRDLDVRIGNTTIVFDHSLSSVRVVYGFTDTFTITKSDPWWPGNIAFDQRTVDLMPNDHYAQLFDSYYIQLGNLAQPSESVGQWLGHLEHWSVKFLEARSAEIAAGSAGASNGGYWTVISYGGQNVYTWNLCPTENGDGYLRLADSADTTKQSITDGSATTATKTTTADGGRTLATTSGTKTTTLNISTVDEGPHLIEDVPC